MPFKMMGKSPLAKALVGKQVNLPPELKAKIQASPEPGSSPAKIIPLLAGKAAALIGKKLLAKGVAKAATKAAAKAGTKAATKKASGKLMEKAGKSLIDNKDNIRANVKSRMSEKGKEEEKVPTAANVSSSNPYANQNTALQMKGKKSSPAKRFKPGGPSNEEIADRLNNKKEPQSFLSENRAKNQKAADNFKINFGGDKSNYFSSQNAVVSVSATQKAKDAAANANSNKVSDTPPMNPIEKALQERGAAIIKRGQVKGNQRAYDRAKRQGYDAEAVTGLTEGRGPKSGSGGKTSRSINRQITKSEKSDDRVVKQGKRQEERTKRVALRNAPKSPKVEKAPKAVEAPKVEKEDKVKKVKDLTKGQKRRAAKKVEGYVKPVGKRKQKRLNEKATKQFEKSTDKSKKGGLSNLKKPNVPSSIAEVPVAKQSKPNPVENAYTPPTKKQKNKTAKGESRKKSREIRRLKNEETGKRTKRGESIGDGTRGISKDSKSYREDQTKRQALKAEKEKRKNIGKSPAEMKTKTPYKMMKKAPAKMIKKKK